MKALLVFAIVLLIAYGVGSLSLRLLRLQVDHAHLRNVFALSLGLGVIAYTVLVIGLLGILTPAAVGVALLLLATAWLGTMPLTSFRGSLSDRGIRLRMSGNGPPLGAGDTPGEPGGGRSLGHGPARILNIAAVIVCALIGFIVLINCFVPPAGHEWDALSYHLAAPKRYIAAHRIGYLPTDHHSNFPFLVEMLFTVGLLFEGYALANLFHFTLAALTVACAVAIARRFQVGAGATAAVVIATTPIIVWEAGAAYIEMGLSLYVLAAVAAVLEYRDSRNMRWLALAGVLMGFALAVKALALVPFVLVGALLLFADRAGLAGALRYVLPAVVVGCPFYVKSWVQTGNPVYPFAYRVFGGRDWSQDLSDAYSTEQRSFGQSGDYYGVRDDLADRPREWKAPDITQREKNLVSAPFDLVAVPRIFYNFNDVGIRSHLGFLFLALPPLLALIKPRAPAALWLIGLATLWFVAWSQTMQYVRYLVPIVPLLALAGGEGAASLARAAKPLGPLIGVALLVQTALTLLAFGPLLPEQWRRATDAEAREQYLRRTVNVYAPQQWINEKTPHDAKVVLFEDTRGFYLDRDYLWGNSPHSLYIPWDASLLDGDAMADWFLQRGYRFALVNLQFAPMAQSAEGLQRLREAVQSQAESRLMLDWYNARTLGESWRRTLGDALVKGRAVVVVEGTSHATVVLEFRPRLGGSR